MAIKVTGGSFSRNKGSGIRIGGIPDGDAELTGVAADENESDGLTIGSNQPEEEGESDANTSEARWYKNRPVQVGVLIVVIGGLVLSGLLWLFSKIF